MGAGYLIALSIVVAVAVGGLLGWVLNHGTRALPRIAHQTVVLHTDEGSYRGVLVGQYRDAFVLAYASMLGTDSDAMMPGHVYVPRAKVSLIQAT